MSQEDLAEESGLSVSSISAYERGANDPSVEALEALSEVFGVPRGVVLDIDPNQVPKASDYLGVPSPKRR